MTKTVPATIDPGPPRLPRPVRALLAALFLSSFAAVGQITVLGLQVYDMTGQPFDLGMLGFAEFLPAFLLAPVTVRWPTQVSWGRPPPSA